jgi:hypothetical protein
MSERVVPLLATGVPTVQNGGVGSRDGMDVDLDAAPGAVWHDVPFTSADRSSDHAINGPN